MRTPFDRLGLSRQTITDLFHYLLPARAHANAMRHPAAQEPELDLLPALVDPTREAVDVGANVGQYTAALAPLASRVIAVEAHPRLARVLSGIGARNVEIVRRAASDRGGQTVRLAVLRQGSRELDGYGRLIAGAPEPGDRIYTAETMTLDDLADRPIGFVKIDVEGHERAVLAGATRLVERRHPVFLVEAEARHRDGAPFDIFAWFVAHGYGGYFLREGRLDPVDAFTLDLQQPAALAGTESYINNFLFLPAGFDLAALKARLPALLAAR